VFVKNTPESTGALSKLVSALISRDVTIVSLLANEPAIENLRDRQIRYDINCRAENGELVNVEMCLDPKPYEPVRLEFHTAKLFIGQDIRGIDKSYDDLKRTYQIAILVNEQFFPDKEFLHTFEYYDSIRGVSLNGRTQIITLELTKLDKVVEKPIKEMNVSERWAIFFKYLTDKSKRDMINEILEVEEGIAMASQVLLKVSRDEEERARLMRDEKIELDYWGGLPDAKKEGRIEVAQKALEKNLPIDIIQEITGLDVEVISGLRK
jgi:predicted transposase/invertase (TIGR01784 family)